MQLLTPSFTKEFNCIADKCTYSCCKNWSVLFHEEHRQKFLNNGITDIDELSNKKAPDLYSMRLTEDGSCPYLNENGLCKMIIKCGNDKVLCDTCQTFPRIIQIKNNVMEYTLSNACPAVLKILEKAPCPMTFELEDVNNRLNLSDVADANLIECRDMMIDLMQIEDFPIWLRLYLIYTFAEKIRTTSNSDYSSIIDQYNSVDYLIQMYNGLVNVDNNIPIKLQTLANFLLIIENKNTTDSYEKHYIELYDYATAIPMIEILATLPEFDEMYDNYNSLMENIAVNHIFRDIKCDNKNNFYYSTFILIELMSLSKFTIMLEWLYNGKASLDDNIYNIITYFARKLEHGDFDSILKHILSFEKKGTLENGSIFMMIR